MAHAFRQVDCFSSTATKGNALAVVHEADDLSTEQMASFARWTNLSETTFLLKPTVSGADYRVRIFTPLQELPFAGHPTIGSCHAWLEAGGKPKGDDIVQECGAGLITVRREAERLAFATPPLVRSGPVDETVLQRALNGIGLARASLVDAAGSTTGQAGWVCCLPPARTCWRSSRTSRS